MKLVFVNKVNYPVFRQFIHYYLNEIYDYTDGLHMDEFGNFLVMCPYCGYINYVNDKDIPEDIKKEIINRSKSKDGEINYHKSLIKKLERENYKKK